MPPGGVDANGQPIGAVDGKNAYSPMPSLPQALGSLNQMRQNTSDLRQAQRKQYSTSSLFRGGGFQVNGGAAAAAENQNQQRTTASDWVALKNHHTRATTAASGVVRMGIQNDVNRTALPTANDNVYGLGRADR